MVTILSVLVAMTEAAPPSAMHAALLHMRGDSVQAQDELEMVLTSTPNDSAALFTAACFEVESGNFSAATTYATRLRGVSPRSRHASVLDALVARRVRLPSERIDDALVEAWRESGRPDLSSPPFLPPIEEWWMDLVPDLEPDALARLTAPERLVFASLGGALIHDDYYENVIAAAGTADTNPLVVNLEILQSLSPSTPPHVAPPIPDALRDDARRAIARLAPLVTAADPGNGYLALAAWMPSAGLDTPLGTEDLALLERAVAQPRFKIPRREILRETRDMASSVDPLYGSIRVLMTVGGGETLPLVWLNKRAVATTEPALRHRTSRVLARAAMRIEDSGAMLDRMLSLVLRDASAKLQGDEAHAAAVRGELERERHRLDRLREGVKRLGTWPFAGPLREWNPEAEMARLERLAE